MTRRWAESLLIGRLAALFGASVAAVPSCAAVERIDLGREPSEREDAGSSLEIQIAFDSDRDAFNRDIYVMHPDGSSLKRLTSDPSTEREPAFSSDGRRIAFASDRVGAKMQIFVMNLATSAVTQITSRTEGADQPAWSADDELVAFHSGTGVFTVSPLGEGERKWFSGPDKLNSFAHPVFSPDGAWLVADRGNQVDAIRLDGTEEHEIVPNTTSTEEAPTIAPTSARLAFATFCEAGIESVWVVPMGGITEDPCTTSVRLSPPGQFATQPAWGPAGFVAYEVGLGSREIFLIPEKGGETVNLTNDPADDRNPAWSPGIGALVSGAVTP